MSTNHTPNYNLCQWEATDQVLRSDFNQDNAKIDAALGGLAARTGLVLLNEITLTEASNNIQIPLRLDWTEWKIIHIDVFPASGTSSNMYFCGSPSPHDKVAALPTTYSHIMFFPWGRGDTIFTTFVLGPTFVYDQRNYPYRNCHGVLFHGEGTENHMTAGSRIIVRGERV